MKVLIYFLFFLINNSVNIFTANKHSEFKLMKVYFFTLTSVVIILFSSFFNLKQVPGLPKNKSQAIIYYEYSDPSMANIKGSYILYCNSQKAHFIETPGDNPEQYFFDYSQQAVMRFQTINGTSYETLSSFDELPRAEEFSDTLSILGHVCQKEQYFQLADTLTAWVWKQNYLNGSPSASIVSNEGLILQIDRNNQTEWKAVKIQYQTIRKKTFAWPITIGPFVNASRYESVQLNHKNLTIPIFQHEEILSGLATNYPSFNHFTSTYHYASGTILLRKVKLPVLKGNYSLFAELTEYSNGDPSARQGSIFIIPVNQKKNILDGLAKGISFIPTYKSHNGINYQGILHTSTFSPLIEIMRFSTPYGIRAFNRKVKINSISWADSVTWRQDISELEGALVHEVWIGAYIDENDSKGHILNLNLHYYPDGPNLKKAQKIWILPLFNTMNVLSKIGQEPGTIFMNDSLHMKFTIPDGLKSLELRYISSAEGPWPNGEAFKHRLNQIFLDDDELYKITPWRNDCGNYRLLSPASPLLSNGLYQSDFSRSGWCPGSLTEPVLIPIDDFDEGEHELKVSIPMDSTSNGKEGYWNVSGVLIGHY